jgi:hypothetical protein
MKYTGWCQNDFNNLGASQDTRRAYYYGVCAMPAVAAYWRTVAASILGVEGVDVGVNGSSK